MNYFILHNGSQHGPYSDAEIRNMLSTHNITLNDYAWTDGLSEWKKLKEFSEFYINPPYFATIEKGIDYMVEDSKREWRQFGKAIGYTFIGLIIIVITINIIESINKPDLDYASNFGRARYDVDNLSTLLDKYHGQNGIKPTTEQGLDALVNLPSISPIPSNWTQLTNSIPLDPWGRSYIYRCPSGDLKGYELFSLGKDGKEGNGDIGIFCR